jgi:ribosomal protein S12 methylthiotransferase accessory factor
MIVDHDHVLLLTERGSRLLTGSAYVALAEGFAQCKNIDEIVASAPVSDAAAIFYAFDHLRAFGAVRESTEESPSPNEGFWDSAGVDPELAAKEIAKTTVTLFAVGERVTTDHMAAALTAAGATIADDGNFAVVLTDDYLRTDLAPLNERFLQSGIPWLLARTCGSILWLGPLLRPGTSACWECMAHRLRSHRHVETFVQKRMKTPYPSLWANYALPSTEQAATSLIALEIAKSVANAGSRQLESVLLTFDLATLTTQRHIVTRRPQCSVCGDPESSTSPPRPVRLTSRPTQFDGDGGHRQSSPEETLARYSHLLSPLTGIVRELTIPTGLDAITPVYLSGPNVAANDDSVESLRCHFRATTAGKGKTDAQARVSAMGEAVERYCGVFQGNERRTRSSYKSLGAAAIHPNLCLQFSEAQFARRMEEPASRFARVPPPVEECAEIDWSPLWSLTNETFRYLPTSYCYFEYKPGADERFCWSDSNGCAAGNSPEEAILQGFLELAERDSVALWWYNEIRRPAVDLDSFDDPYFQVLRKYYRSLNRDLWVIDITTDLGIPSFVALSRRFDSPAEDIIFGFGAHLDARLGVLRALTETNQFLPSVIDRHSDPAAPLRVSEEDVRVWLETSTLANRRFLAPAEGPSISARDYPVLEYDDLKDEVEHCVAIAAARGMETLVLDQTRPDVQLPVFRVVVPGLRHFWPRFAPGRLYDIPVALGWLQAPIPEDQLNPIVVSF